MVGDERVVAQGGPGVRPASGFESRRARLDAQPVVYGVPKLLFAPEVTLGRLDRDVPEQKLDLVQFAAGQVAQSRTGASQVVRGQLRDAGFGGPAAAARTTSHSTIAVIPLPQTRPPLLMARNTVPSVIHAAVIHAPIASLTQAGMGTVRTCPPCRRDQR